MGGNELDFVIIGLLAVAVLLLIIIAVKLFTAKSASVDLEKVKAEILSELRGSRQEINSSTGQSVKSMGDVISSTQKQAFELQDKKLEEFKSQMVLRQDTLQSTVFDMVKQMDSRLKSSSMQNEQKLDNIRTTIENRLSSMQDDNNKKLEQMRSTVDEKLQKTLEDRISQSFKLVSDRLEQVYKGLGEMQTLASGVGDLKKVLSNVKTRGILGEIQLGAILEEILSPEQYETNFETKKGSKKVVEFAVKLPGDDDGSGVYLPIDSKFPGDTYSQLMDAYDSGSPAEIEQCLKQLETAIKLAAKDIRDKYIDPPNTTDFAIMFLPFEGLYSEVVRRGLVEKLQSEYKVNIAGPTTMAALLNSLQMGFKTLAIQKRSGEVWNILSAVKTEFNKFSDTLVATQRKLELAHNELDNLVGVRTRQMQRKLSKVTEMPESETVALFENADIEE